MPRVRDHDVTITTSILIPAYNEAGRLQRGFDRIAPVLDDLDTSTTEVVFIDDGSSDGTMARAYEVYGHLAHRLFIQQPINRGKGAALRLGIGVALGDNIITADADMAIDPVHLRAMIEALHECPVVPGSRVVGGRIRYDSTVRTAAGYFFNRLVRHYTRTELRDTQCGFKGFQRGPARVLALLGMVDRFAFDAELLYLADQLDLEVRPLQVTWHDVEGSSLRVGRDSIEMLRDMRGLKRTRYENPVVELEPDVDVTAIADAARRARAQGLVVARGDKNALLVLPRDGALGGLAIAETLGGSLRTAGIGELRARRYDPV